MRSRQAVFGAVKLASVARAARMLSTVLITAGLVVLADVGITLAYKEPVSSIYGAIQQQAAADELAKLDASYPTAADLRAIAGVHGDLAKVKILARRFARQAKQGQAIGRIIVPAMASLNTVVVQGTDTASLEKGPGHYPQTPFPGQGGTAAIAGHRTTYLAPFRHLDSVRVGDLITLQMPYATLTYLVEKTKIVDPSDVGIIRRVNHERLVLTACNPLYSAAQRIAVFARLSAVAIFDATRGGPFPAN